MDLERRRDRLDLNPGLLTQTNGRELKLVAVLVDLSWAGSRHDTSIVR